MCQEFCPQLIIHLKVLIDTITVKCIIINVIREDWLISDASVLVYLWPDE